MQNNLKEYLENIAHIYSDSKEGLIILTGESQICYVNAAIHSLFGEKIAIHAIEHRFYFDICILNEDDILNYNPLRACIESVEDFKSEILYQYEDNKYKNLILRSFNKYNYKFIVISDVTSEMSCPELTAQVYEYKNRIKHLEKEKAEYQTLGESSEIQAIRVNLVNRVSVLIRDSLDINKIIQISLNEIAKTLGLYCAFFATYEQDAEKFIVKNDWYADPSRKISFTEINPAMDKDISGILSSCKAGISCKMDLIAKNTEKIDESLRSRLLVPVVHQDKVLGLMGFYHTNSKRSWHQEEISLIEGIMAQIAAVIYQISLFNELEVQKIELEETLLKLKETQTHLIQSEKMAALGQLVAGIAHEINTPLGAISSNNDLVIKCTERFRQNLSQHAGNAKILSVLDEVNLVNKEAVTRINNIVKALRNFVRLDEADLKQVDLHDGIKSTLMLINHEIKNRITIIEDYADLPFVECYPNLLNQVFMNMLVNAYQSIDNKGSINIKTQVVDDNAVVSISDTGKGISAENLSKIFNPGFTTKKVGVGTGLGLSICYQIIEKHKGNIKVDSEEGKGAIFTIEIPIRQIST